MKRVLRTVLIALLATSVAFGIYVSVYYRATDAALSCLDDGDGARVKLVGNTYCIEAAGAADALVLYPGAKIQAEAYMPLLRRIAADGIDCYLVKMPFNLAVFGVNRVEGVMAAHPHDRWLLAGHSLGGAMAALWAAEHPGRLDGLALLAAYPTKPLPEDLQVLVLYGSEDGVLNRNKLEKSSPLLPPNAVVRQLPGGNHAYFGSYGEQKGDGVATISPEAQWELTAEWIFRMFNGDLPRDEGS
jgi:hypothetical protein